MIIGATTGSVVDLGDLATNARNLTLQGESNQIIATFTGTTYLDLAKEYHVVAKVGSMPDKPTDGARVIVPKGTAISQTHTVTIDVPQNDVLYYVRVFTKCTHGWQCSIDAVGTVTPLGGILISALPVGAVVKLDENGIGVNYLIVNQGRPSSMYDVSCNGAWVLRKDIAEERQWHSSNVNDYANSTIKAYLDNTFINRFSANIKAAIKQVKIPYRPGSGTGTNVNSGANGLSCKGFLLGVYEVGLSSANNLIFVQDGAKLAYFEAGAGTSANNKRIAHLNGVASIWWLRFPFAHSSSDEKSAWTITDIGYYTARVCSSSYGIRPAFIFPSDFLLDPTPNPDGSYSPL